MINSAIPVAKPVSGLKNLRPRIRFQGCGRRSGSFYSSGKPVALVCHAPGVLRHVTYKGEPLVKGKRVTGFTNEEEEEVQLTKVVPFLVEDELKRLGAVFEKVPNWQPFAVVDGHLITGQNPASSTSAAQALLKTIAAEKAA